MTSPIRLAVVAAALLLLPPGALAQSDPHEHEMADEHADHDDQHVAELGGVRTIHAWTRATSERAALVFVDIDNTSAADVVLEGGACACAQSVELVGFRLVDGEADYAPLAAVPIRAGRELVLAPNGLAFRLNGLVAGLHQGDELEMEIEFSIGHLDVHVAVEAADATQHSHAGHIH